MAIMKKTLVETAKETLMTEASIASDLKKLTDRYVHATRKNGDWQDGVLRYDPKSKWYAVFGEEDMITFNAGHVKKIGKHKDEHGDEVDNIWLKE
jgi:hypothetical protein